MIGFLKVCKQRQTPEHLPGRPVRVCVPACNPPLLTWIRYSDMKHQRPRWAGTSPPSVNSSYRL